MGWHSYSSPWRLQLVSEEFSLFLDPLEASHPSVMLRTILFSEDTDLFKEQSPLRT